MDRGERASSFSGSAAELVEAVVEDERGWRGTSQRERPGHREADAPSYSHKVAKNDVPRVHPPDIARTSMQVVLIGERLLVEIGLPARFWR